MFFFGIVWSVWNVHNNLIFNEKKTRLDDLYYSLFHRVARWAKYNDVNFYYSGSNLFCSLDGLFICTIRTNKRNDSSWIHLAIGMLKWNVDASSNDKPRLLGIGGFLKDHERRFLCIGFVPQVIWILMKLR